MQMIVFSVAVDPKCPAYDCYNLNKMSYNLTSCCAQCVSICCIAEDNWCLYCSIFGAAYSVVVIVDLLV